MLILTFCWSAKRAQLLSQVNRVFIIINQGAKDVYLISGNRKLVNPASGAAFIWYVGKNGGLSDLVIDIFYFEESPPVR